MVQQNHDGKIAEAKLNQQNYVSKFAASKFFQQNHDSKIDAAKLVQQNHDSKIAEAKFVTPPFSTHSECAQMGVTAVLVFHNTRLIVVQGVK